MRGVIWGTVLLLAFGAAPPGLAQSRSAGAHGTRPSIGHKKADGGSRPWQERTYTNHEAVARALYEETALLDAGKLKPADLVPALRDQRELFRDDDGAAIAVRDLAFAMLEEAGRARMPVASTRTKLICGCEVKGEWYRFHVPALSDRDFEAVIEAIQTARAGEGKSRGK